MKEALFAAESAENKRAALNELEFDKVANSARASKASTWATWQRMHRAWFGDSLPPLPLTAEKIRAVAAMFKAGHYASFANYSSRAKAEHIVQAAVHKAPWTEELAFELRAAQRSISRGVGPSKQSFPIDLCKVVKLDVGDEPAVMGGPIGPVDFAIICTFFLARELELACAKIGNFHIDANELEVTWNLPVSKNDVEALGTHRTWGCICSTSKEVGCPFHAAARQMERARACCSEVGGVADGFPMFPTAMAGIATKAAVVATIEELAARCGLPTRDSLDRPLYGGHSLRTGGAVLLASLGLDTTRIEAMARWNSPMLLYYIRSAPLKSITGEVGKLLLAKDRSAKATSGGDNLSCAALTKAITDLGARLDGALEAMSEREQRVAALEAITAPSQFIFNRTSKVWHQTREHRAGQVCYTSCGWTYTGLQFEVAHALPATVPHKFI